MNVTQEQVAAKVAKMVELSSQKAIIDLKYKELEAFFLKLGNEKLQNTKRKSYSFEDDAGHDVTYTEAKSVKIISPAILRKLMGDAFGDYIKETVEPKYTFKSKEISEPKRKLTVDEFFTQLPCDSNAKAALRKKLKGANFKTDCKNLMTIGGFSEDDAADYAYLFSESLEWERFMTIVGTVGECTDYTDIPGIIRAINSAISVTDSTKITV